MGNNDNFEIENATVTVPLEWFETLIESRTKYIALVNYLLGKAELRKDGTLSIYTSVADILCALEYHKTQGLIDDLKLNKQGEEE